MSGHHILVPLDGSVLAECVLPHVIALGGVFESEITLIRVITPNGKDQVVDPLAWEMKKAEAVSYLQEKTAQLERSFDCVSYQLLEGSAAEKICEYARQENVDLIALSSHGQSGLNDWNISSVVQKTIMHSQKSILLIRAYHAMDPDVQHIEYRKLGLPLDCSQRAELVLPLAVKVAKYYQAQLLMTHVSQEPEIICRNPPSEETLGYAQKLVEFNQDQIAKYFLQIESQLKQQDIEIQTRYQTSKRVPETLHILLEQEQVDLVLFTAHGTTGSHKWPYGNLVTSFILYGSTPVIILQDLKPEEFEISQAEIVAKEFKGH